MTHLMQLPFSLRARLSTGLLMSLLILCAGVLVTGCGEEKKPEPVKKETRAYTPPPVQARTIADLMTEYGIDDRVYMSEDKAPSSEKEKIALLKFFDAWVRGNHEYVIEVLGTADQPQLMAMVQEGQWAASTGDVIDNVELQTGPAKDGGTCVLAIFEHIDVMRDPEAQLWSYRAKNIGNISDDETIGFWAIATPPGMVDRLSGDDRIAEWWKILDEENAMWAMDDSDQLADLSEDEEDEKAGGKKPGKSSSGSSGRRQPGGGRRVPGGR
ncbi:MAG: hypothetical protein P8M22_06725 [Phycisphaerales bacterium]|nr:hypothetical protein [Phycisphaerales bacterium]